MADRGDTHYRVKTLNQWFAFGSITLFAASVWMMYDDWAAEWKPYQREFRAIDAQLTREKLASMETELAEETRLAAELEQARAALAGRQGELDEAEAQLFQLKGEYTEIDRQLKNVKGDNNWTKYIETETNVHHWAAHEQADRVPEALRELNPGFKRQFELEQALETKQRDVAAQQKVVADMTAVATRAEEALKGATKGLELLRTKLAKLAPTAPDERIADVLRDFPGLDFVDPKNKVRKVVCPEIKLDLNFTKTPRIDMCHTCHMGVDRTGFEDQAQPFATHPRLDLFLTAASPHPLNEVGCTACHGGSGEALAFQRSDHRPGDDAERARWREEHHWHKQHHWDYPMLPAKYTQAGCVQCHTSSMELIAADAPKLAQGYALVEENGCYSCHKIEWFPTTRKRGPSLANLGAKLSADFVASWVADPKAFRPSTRMPQIFHLENFGKDDVVVHSQYGEGREMLGGEWSDASVAAVTAYLFDNAPVKPFPAPPVAGDAQRGREAFRLSGCLACHNLAPLDDAADAGSDPAQQRRATNEMGPNLRGVASKLNPDWLYWWIKDPQSYWPDTRMPDLRLSDQEAADIAAYILEDPDGWFHEVPEGWQPAAAPYARDVLEEMARWFFNRQGRFEIDRRLAEEWKEDSALLAAVGEKVILNQGCFSCHEIKGMETAMPIGTELTSWASKTVDKLDFGAMHEILAEERGWDHDQTHEFKTYRDGWLENKLHAPRSYDRLQVKNPLEKLKMPWFDFTDEEVEAIATFVLGLVNDDVHGAKMTPDADQERMEAGQRAVRQNNCAACHVLEPGTVTFTGEDGARHTVAGELLALEEETLPPPMERLAEHVAEYEEYFETEVEEYIVRLLATEPGLGDVGDTLVVPREGTEVRPPHGGDFVRVVTRYYLEGLWDVDEESGDETLLMPDPSGEGAVQDRDGEFRLYTEEPYDKVRWTFAPPVLIDEGGKVQRDWFYAFLNDPVELREQMRVRMPSFHWDSGEAGAVVDWFALRSAREWPVRYARSLRHALGLDVAAMAARMGVKPEVVVGLEAGSRSHLSSNTAGLLELGREVGLAPAASTAPARPQPDVVGDPALEWSPTPAVDPAHERALRRDPSYLNERLGRHPELFSLAYDLATAGPNCLQCHFNEGRAPLDGNAQPIAWAPDLARVRERIREDWTHRWLKNPGRIYPGTAMPANFSSAPPVYQALLPDSTNEDQIQLILDWLYNTDRALRTGTKN